VAALHARARMFEQRVHLLVPRELADRELAREEHGLPGVVATPSEEASTAIRKARLVPPVRVSSLVARSGGGWLPEKMEDMAKLLVVVGKSGWVMTGCDGGGGGTAAGAQERETQGSGSLPRRELPPYLGRLR